jgi:hypothetical protein
MSEFDSGSPTLRVNVYANRVLVNRILCETAEEAGTVAAVWEEQPGYSCEIEDLGAVHSADDVLSPEPDDLYVDDED